MKYLAPSKVNMPPPKKDVLPAPSLFWKNLGSVNKTLLWDLLNPKGYRVKSHLFVIFA